MVEGMLGRKGVYKEQFTLQGVLAAKPFLVFGD